MPPEDPRDVQAVVAAPAAWQRVRSLRLAALADAPDAFWATLAEEADQPDAFWQDRLRAPDRITVLAVRGGADVGLLGCGPHHDDPADALLYSVWVAPAARGSGALRVVLAEAVAWARRRGHRRLRLDVGDHNARAIAAYRAAGFTPTGRRGAFPAPRGHVTEHELALEL